MNKKLVIGILAHVDAGKTTLSESMLYQSGSIRKLGRVDKGDAFLDTYELERERGITIFSKQAQLSIDGLQITLLDTPGMWISLPRWNEHCKCWIMQFLLSAELTECRDTRKPCGNY